MRDNGACPGKRPTRQPADRYAWEKGFRAKDHDVHAVEEKSRGIMVQRQPEIEWPGMTSIICFLDLRVAWRFARRPLVLSLDDAVLPCIFAACTMPLTSTHCGRTPLGVAAAAPCRVRLVRQHGREHAVNCAAWHAMRVWDLAFAAFVGVSVLVKVLSLLGRAARRSETSLRSR